MHPTTGKAAEQAPQGRPSPIRIVIADDQTLFRAGLRLLLAREPDLRVVGDVGTADELQKLLRSTEADILLLNPWMPDLEEEAVRSRLLPIAGTPRTIVLAGRNKPEDLAAVVETGAAGIILKQSSIDQLTEAIRVVCRGEVWWDESFTGSVRRKSSGSRITDPGQPIPMRQRWNRLSPRERDVALLFIRGLRCREIAASLAIGEGTVRSHLRRIYIRLRVSDRRQLVYDVYSKLHPPPEGPTGGQGWTFDRVA